MGFNIPIHFTGKNATLEYRVEHLLEEALSNDLLFLLFKLSMKQSASYLSLLTSTIKRELSLTPPCCDTGTVSCKVAFSLALLANSLLP
jgi:hypothetical protein